MCDYIEKLENTFIYPPHLNSKHLKTSPLFWKLPISPNCRRFFTKFCIEWDPDRLWSFLKFRYETSLTHIQNRFAMSELIEICISELLGYISKMLFTSYWLHLFWTTPCIHISNTFWMCTQQKYFIIHLLTTQICFAYSLFWLYRYIVVDGE